MAIIATCVSSNSFTIEGDRTSEFLAGRKVKADCGTDGTLITTVDSSSYSSGTGLTTVTIKESTLTANLVSVLYGIVKESLPDHSHGATDLPAASESASGIARFATYEEAIADPSPDDVMLSPNGMRGVLLRPGPIGETTPDTIDGTVITAHEGLTLVGADNLPDTVYSARLIGQVDGDNDVGARLITGDGTGWAFRISKRTGGVTTDLFSFNDDGTSSFAPAAKGVTNGDSHDHSGGDGAQIAYSSLSGLPVINPTGSVLMWCATTAPTGYLLCDGSAVSRTAYATLYAVIGTAFGAGDGSTTFNVPDLRGRIPMGVDGAANRVTSASTNGGNADTLGAAGGAETHTLTTSEMPAHDHNFASPAYATLAAGKGSQTLPYNTGGDWGNLHNPLTATAGSNGAHSNTQPWIALNFIIKY